MFSYLLILGEITWTFLDFSDILSDEKNEILSVSTFLSIIMSYFDDLSYD